MKARALEPLCWRSLQYARAPPLRADRARMPNRPISLEKQVSDALEALAQGQISWPRANASSVWKRSALSTMNGAPALAPGVGGSRRVRAGASFTRKTDLTSPLSMG